MTIAYIDVAKAPVQVPVIDLLQEPQGAAFDFISGQAWIVDKANPANTMLRNIGDVLTNPGASPTKLLRRKSGLLESAPWWANEYDLAGNPMGMRTSTQRTNLMRYSASFDLRTTTSIAVNANVATAPDGTMTADEVVAIGTSATGTRRLYRAVGVETGVKYCRSLFVKKTPTTPSYLLLNDDTSQFAYFDLQTMTFGNVSIGVTGGVDAFKDGWYRLWYSYTPPSSNASSNHFIYLTDRQAASPIAFVGGESLLVWGEQVEQGPFPTSYIPTDAAAVTRAADLPQIVTGFLPYNPAAGTLILNGMGYDYDGVNANALEFSYSSIRYAALRKNDAGSRNTNLEFIVRNDGLNLADLSIGSFPVSPNPGKVGSTWGAEGVAAASGVTGTVKEVAATFTNPLTLSSLVFRPVDGIMWYRSAIYIPRKLTTAELLARVRP